MAVQPVNSTFREKDLEMWRDYHRSKSPSARDALLKRFDGAIQSAVNRWAGPVPRQVLVSEAKLLAIKAFDSYNPNAGAALATHVINNLQPLSRIVYTYQNTARVPENSVIKINTYNSAVENLTAYYGRKPTTDELHSELGWTAQEIGRMRDYTRKNLVESGQAVSGDFYDDTEDDSDVVLAGIYAELLPDEKELFELTTGYNGRRTMKNPEIMKKLNLSQSQLSYKKTLLTKKIRDIKRRHGL